MRIFDISMPLQPGMVVWPGDTAFELDRVFRRAHGDSVNVGSMITSLHAGTHVDAPRHLEDHLPGVEAIRLDCVWGRCQLIDQGSHPEISRELLENSVADSTERLLVKTSAWGNRAQFPSAIPTLTVSAAEWLAARGMRLFGVDLPSVDQIDSKALLIHHLLVEHGIVILEGLCLDEVPAGHYEISALPLRIPGMDAAPVRAVLRSLQ